MKNLKYLSLILMAGILIFSCTKEEDENPFVSIETKGAVASFQNVSGFFDIVEPSTSSVSFDLNTKGESVSSIEIFKSIKGGAEASLSTVSSFPSNITITFDQALAGSGLSTSDLSPGDKANFRTMVTTGTGTYPGATVSFDFSCSSNLGGEYDVVTSGSSTDDCCPDATTVETTITLTDEGSGKYTISDWSGGLYIEWYTVYGITPDDMVGEIQDICNSISFITDGEPFGETLEGSGSVDPSTGVITFAWVNGYADQGTVTMTPK